MKTAFFTLLVMVAALWLWPASSFAEDATEKGFALMKAESLGGLKLEMPAATVEALLGKPDKKGKDIGWEAIGEFVQEWNWPKKGVVLQMSSVEKGGKKAVLMATVSPPSTSATAKGIKIGSTEAEVRKAYAAYADKEDSKPGETFVAGTVYGGVIFTFKEGKVITIFLGAAAE